MVPHRVKVRLPNAPPTKPHKDKKKYKRKKKHPDPVDSEVLHRRYVG